MSILAQHRVETRTTLRGEYLTPVALAYRRDFVGVKNPPLQKIHPPEKFDAAKSKEPLVQIGQFEVESPKTALLRQMMDGQHVGKWQMLGMRQHRDERRRPIVCMQDLHGRC